jgi:hypothetical protein
MEVPGTGSDFRNRASSMPITGQLAVSTEHILYEQRAGPYHRYFILCDNYTRTGGGGAVSKYATAG